MRLIDADNLAAKIMMEAPDFMDGGSSITKAFILAMIRTKSITPTVDAHDLLKDKEVPEELKLKMWNALYAVEDECEKQFVGTDEHDAWFNTFRPWLQKGFDIAIKTIADWEGR